MRLFFSIVWAFFICPTAIQATTLFFPPDSTSSVASRLAASYMIDDGKKMLNQGRKLDALQKFREAYSRDQFSAKAAYWIGETHFTLNNYGYAKDYGLLAKTLNKSDDAEISFLLGKSYHRLEMLDSAMYFLEVANQLWSSSKKKTFQLPMLIENVQFAIALKDKAQQFQKELLDDNINSGYDDYAPFITADGKEMYFVSRRPDTKGGNTNPSDQSFFEDIYYAKWNSTTNSWEKANNTTFEKLNSEGFDAVNYITDDKTQMFMTVNTAILNVGNPTKSSDIFTVELGKDGKWGKPKPIHNKTINTSYFDGAPTVTADGNTMYFVSDRDGEKSKSDIYIVEKDGKKWGTAKKLPMNVNTVENETTPYITPDGKFLFFSSTGHPGMGGYDVYVTENLGNNTWSNPINLGKDFNTVNDDIFFKYFPQLNKGVISSYYLQGKKSSLDIFEINLEGWEIPKK